MNRTTLGILLISLVAMFVVAVLVMNRGGSPDSGTDSTVVVPTEDPIDVATGVASRWLENLAATTSVPLGQFLGTETSMTEPVIAQLRARNTAAQDPITCQSAVPRRVGGKMIYQTDTEAQVMVLPRGLEDAATTAIVTVEAIAGSWTIVDWQCSNGEMAPDREFSFTQTGRLVQDSVPAPYDQAVWHVIFSEGDRVGIVPLTFTGESVCDTGVCDQTQLTEGTPVTIRGDMTEAGAVVKQLEQE